VVVAPVAGVVRTAARLEPAAALLTLSVTLDVGVVVVAVVVVIAALTPAAPCVVCVVLVLPPEPLTDPVEIEPTLAKAWLRLATPAILIVTPNVKIALRLGPKSLRFRSGGGHKIGRVRRRFVSANRS
jgi:hypothetical protein